MEDTISRKAAIDAVWSMLRRKFGIGGDLAEITLAGLPSAQPVAKDINVPVKDCISRQAVIEINRSYHGQMPNEVNHRIWKEINELPSAQPELPEWAQKVEEYRKSAPSFVRNQLVWALYQTWKEYDGQLVHQRGKENRWLNI